ncbi:hypothetical protein ACJJIE_02585 [Microbulbifer sp. TRSA001]|uniref:hypothetical protein n=1 Tax=Microbulbifer sp. TRSA001 TaxID=3243381 RepID=UPI004039E325
MSDQIIKLPRQVDKKVWGVFKGLASTYSVSKINVSGIGFLELRNINPKSPPEDMEVLLSKNSSLIDKIVLTLKGLYISYHRGGKERPENKSGVFDEIWISKNNQGEISNEDKIEIFATISKELNSFDSSKSIKTDPEAQAQLEAMHISTLERLENLNEELIRKSAEFREKLEAQYDAKSESLANKLKEDKDRLEGKYRAKNEILETKTAEVDARIKGIDDRDNTHVRRGIRQEIQEIIKSRSTEFKLTPGTNRLRIPIHILCNVLIFLFALGGIWYAAELFEYLGGGSATTTNVIILAIKQLSLTAGGIATAVFYLKWLNRWFEQHSQAEFHLKQFQLDIDRASWVVETSLEWKASLGTGIPTVLMESITKNLFEKENDASVPDIDAGDQLASALLGSASKVRVQAGSGNAELEFEGKKLKKEMASQS